MAEQDMIKGLQAALDDLGIDDHIVEVGQFEPRGMTGSLFAGGMIGDEIGGSVGGAIGMLGGMAESKHASGLPLHVLVGASASTVYGFAMSKRGRRGEPHQLLFRIPREQLKAVVHSRVNVRILELVDESSGSRIELEGNRLPITHSHDLIDYVTSGAS
jgi:hypothetical protein